MDSLRAVGPNIAHYLPRLNVKGYPGKRFHLRIARVEQSFDCAQRALAALADPIGLVELIHMNIGHVRCLLIKAANLPMGAAFFLYDHLPFS